MAYEILTGRKPFTADYLPTLFYKVCSEEPPAVHELNPTLGPLADRAVRKALAKKPEDRYATCAEFITVLQRALAGTPEWTPMAKGPMPVADETTTGSGGRIAVAPEPDFQPTVVVPPRVAESVPPTPAPEPPKPLAEPPKPAVEPTMPSMRIPIREMEAQQQTAAGPNKGILAAGAVAVLAIASFFGYSQMSKPSAEPPAEPAITLPVTGDKKSDKPAAANKKGPDPAPKQNPTAPPPVDKQPPVDKPKDPPTPAQKDFDVAFATAPAGATITADGSQTCTAPCPLKLTTGRHGIQITLQGYLTTFKTIEVPQVLDLFVTLPEATGVLSVLSTPPGASILVDGKPRAEKTPAKLTLREGAHKIEIVSGTLRDSHDVSIKQGGIHQVQSQW